MISTKKPIILTNFGYQRKNWIEPLEAIKDQYDIVYLHFNDQNDEYEKYTDSEVLYYSDFKNAQELIDKVQPSIYITMGLNSYQTYAIRYICKRKKIPFVYMDHGLYGKQEDYNKKSNVKIEKHHISPIKNKDSIRSTNYTFALFTFLRAFALVKLSLIFVQIIYGKVTGKNPFSTSIHKYLVRPDKFISYSKENFRINQSLFSPKGEDVFFVGNFEYDKFRVASNTSLEQYVLFIDSPLSDNPSNRYSFDTDTHLKIYKKANEFAINNHLKLKIKLHPYNYFSKWLIKDENIEYIRNVDINTLIKQSEYCISFYSTLLVPAIYFKPTIVLKVKEHSFIDFIEKENLSTIYTIEEFIQSKISLPQKKADISEDFKSLYFNLDDQTSEERIKNAIGKIIGL